MPDPTQRLDHLLVRDRVEDEEFARGGGGRSKVRDVDRYRHGAGMLDELQSAFDTQDQARDEWELDELKSLGSVITIEAGEGFALKLESLDSMTRHRKQPRKTRWTVLSVHPATDNTPEQVTIWIADEHRAQFEKLFADYLDDDKLSRKGNPRNRTLVANMAGIRASLLRDLWQSDGEPPMHGKHWWEVWLRAEADAVGSAHAFCGAWELRMSSKVLRLDGRSVIWVEATWDELRPLPVTKVPVAEIRKPAFVDTIQDLDLDEQMEWVDDLVDRVVPADEQAPAVCLLDTGVRRTHVLLRDSLGDADMHSVVGDPVGDRKGHGTSMAGLALFGPLDGPRLGTGSVRLSHRLESVKLLYDEKERSHDPEAYGIVTAEAVDRPVISGTRRRVYCMPITTKAEKSGVPSLWAAAVDALAVGTGVGVADDGIELLGPPSTDAARLLVISAGNVTPESTFQKDYRDLCDVSPIEDPAQAWNALTIGAYTEKTDLPSDRSYEGWRVLAEAGDISPHSRTGVKVHGSGWPIKPDICMEGGNVLTDESGDFDGRHPLLSLLSTGHAHDAAIGSANATSAATAQAARLAALAMARYPSYWPETIRGLLVHHAEWTPLMRSLIDAEFGKKARQSLVKRYGWGVPHEQEVLTSASNAVTMVTQDEFQAFAGRDYAMRNFRLHSLPWPTGALQELDAQDVELRVTLSYFIEPAAPRRGWRGRYTYASHGLRFELQAPNESHGDFVRRVNREARSEEAGGTSSRGPDQWIIGPNQRRLGSLHQDIWRGHGAELAATRGAIAVYPVGGWWKNGKRKDRMDLPIRYTLIVSLRTAANEVDIYTPIATELAVPVESAAIEI